MARTATRSTVRNPLAVDPNHESRVRERAYLLWESEGKPHGRDVEYWERARELINQEDSAGASSPGEATMSESPSDTAVDESNTEERSSEPPGRPADQGNVKPAAVAKRKTRAKAKKPS